MIKKVLFLMVASIFMISASAIAQDLTIAEMEVCKKMEKMVPVEPGDSFDKAIGHLYCYTKITGSQGEDVIYHAWYLNDELKAKVELKVKASSWRTYSRKTIPETWTGNWRVDILDANGKVLKTKNFTVQ